MHHEDLLERGDETDRSKILARVVARVVAIEARRDAEHAGMADHERMAVGRGLRDGACAKRSGCAAAVVDHELLAERAAHVLSQQARHDVVAAAGCERNDDGDWLGRIGLRSGDPSRACKARYEQYRSRASASPVHWFLPE